MAKKLMKGCEAVAEAAIQAGCHYFFGYPITPQNDIPEYMARRLPQVGGCFLQAESEVAAINMVYGAAAAGARCMTSSSSPGISLKQEGMTYLAGAELPCVVVNMVRGGPGLGSIQPSQGDYFQATRGGGHGDYRTIVLAPASVQENADLAYIAFDLAEKYTHPVIVGSDAAIGQMVEPVELPEMIEHDIDTYDWAIRGRRAGEKQRIVMNTYYKIGPDKYITYLRDKYKAITENEQRWESVNTEDAEIVLVAYGISSRVSKSAVKMARAQGMKLGLIRPITLWPFPQKAFDALGEQVKGFLTVEMNILGQMADDVILACGNRRPVESYGEFSEVPSEKKILDIAAEMLKKH